MILGLKDLWGTNGDDQLTSPVMAPSTASPHGVGSMTIGLDGNDALTSEYWVAPRAFQVLMGGPGNDTYRAPATATTIIAEVGGDVPENTVNVSLHFDTSKSSAYTIDNRHLIARDLSNDCIVVVVDAYKQDFYIHGISPKEDTLTEDGGYTTRMDIVWKYKSSFNVNTDDYAPNELGDLQALFIDPYTKEPVLDIRNVYNLCENLSDMMDDPLYMYGTSSNSFFNEAVYLQNKADAMNVYEGGSWSVSTVRNAIASAGMSAWEHYQQYGAYERNALGEIGIDPSNSFDTSQYYDDKRALMASQGEYVTLDALAAIFRDCNIDPVSHYLQFGASEGLTPSTAQGGSDWAVHFLGNFNETEYIRNKTAAINASGESWTEAGILKAILDAGMSPLTHYHYYGAYERDASGQIGIDPSSSFDTSLYYQNKLAQLAHIGQAMSQQELIGILQANGLDPMLHYAKYGRDEGVSGQEVQTMGVNYLDDAEPGA